MQTDLIPTFRDLRLNLYLMKSLWLNLGYCVILLKPYFKERSHVMFADTQSNLNAGMNPARHGYLSSMPCA